MQVIITAVGPDNRGLADPIVHYVAQCGANISEIQMYDHDSERLFAMLLRLDWPEERASVARLREQMSDIGAVKGLTVRTWSREEHQRPPRLAICTTYLPHSARAILQAVSDGDLHATPAVMIGNRMACQSLAADFDIDFHHLGDREGNIDYGAMVALWDQYEIDYVVLARYMRILPARICWEFGGGRIINLHHGLLPGFPGIRPYHDAYSHRMLTYGATSHFIVPELDAGNQIINQTTFTVPPGTPLETILQHGQTVNEPDCLLGGIRRVVHHEVELHFHRVVGIPAAGNSPE